jgi:hypothetical protein
MRRHNFILFFFLLILVLVMSAIFVSQTIKIHKLRENIRHLNTASIETSTDTNTILTAYFENIRTKNKAVTNFDSCFKTDSVNQDSSERKNWFVSWSDKYTQMFGYNYLPTYTSYGKCLEVCDSLNKKDTIIQHVPMIDLKAAKRYMLRQARMKYILSE